MPDRSPCPLVAASLALALPPWLFAGTPASLALALSALLLAGAPASVPEPTIAELRARGPAALDALLSQYDRAAPSERDALAARIDAVAGQRHATVSRLYWYTELDRAEQAARELHRPILALRMLGDLRDDLSCANSRLFRATLYANQQVAAFLRAHFVLYWSSERAVPKVTIEFGDGRKIVRTTTGNSAHYVLDENGHVLDVLPGLYAPMVFERELTSSLALATRVRGLPEAQRIRETVRYHTEAAARTGEAFRQASDALWVRGRRFLLDADARSSALETAQRATMAKAAMEVPDLQQIGFLRPDQVPLDDAAWSAIGQKAWNIGDAASAPRHRDPRPDRARARSLPPAPMVLDASSQTLVAALHNAGPADLRATAADLAAVVARLEQHIVADTALDQFVLRQRIHEHIATRGDTEFVTLNAWIYETVFATPKSDEWLGLVPRTEFTGLPGDGVVTR